MSELLVLREYYIRYLRDVRGSKESTINHYLGALNVISKYLVSQGKITSSIYEVGNINELEILKEFVFSQKDFAEKDARGNQMYSAGMNNYLRFAKGEEFASAGKHIECLDMVVPIGGKDTVLIENWKRNTIIRKQTIEMANYECEVDPNHFTFMAASTGHQYMESHHAIPIKLQVRFPVSLDVYANIVCLCPVCHRLLHYGVNEDKEGLLNKIYYERSERMEKSGIKLSKSEFINVANA